jgi:23S rRNA (pseudouridine1915-N3)-methyltransferase
MKLHIITVGQPKLEYAKLGWDEYFKRLGRFHQLRSTHIPDKHNDAQHILEAAKGTAIVALDSRGKQLTSPELAAWLDKQALQGRELSFIIGGPEGLPTEVIDQALASLSFGKLTFPHDLAMVVLLEALYRASTISAGLPYHRE